MKRNLSFSVLIIAALWALASSCDGGDDAKTLNMIYWQAPTTANPYLSAGSKDVEASALVLEPLAGYDENAALVPRLAKRVPTRENGGVKEVAGTDGKTRTAVTWELKEGVLWSDGTELTTKDVLFTLNYYCSIRENMKSCEPGATDRITISDGGDGRTFTITYDVPGVRAHPYGLLVGFGSPVLQEAQFRDCTGEKARGCAEANMAPVGTGPYKIASFTVDEQKKTSRIVYETNGRFHLKSPFFEKVIIAGGGTAEDAATAVAEGKADYAWNMQVSAETLNAVDRGTGKVISASSGAVERIEINFADPDPALGEKRSEYDGGSNPHPFLTEKPVRQALSLAIDRAPISGLYRSTGKPTCNVVAAPEKFVSTSNDACLAQNIEEARRLLEQAGWTPGADGIRSKTVNGRNVRLSVLYQTSTNSVRQQTQELVKGWWKEIGVETTLKNVDAGTFFSSDLESPDTIGKFYADVQMYTVHAGIDPGGAFGEWETAHISGRANNWSESNTARYSNAEYDRLAMSLIGSAGAERTAKVKQLNDWVVGNYIVIPLINRAEVSARKNDLKGVRITSWDSETWNIHEWYR